MPRRGLLTVVVACLLVAAVHAARAGDAPQRPGWLVGRWEATSAEGPFHVTFEPDGTMEIGGTGADGTPWSDAGGRWEVRDGALVVGDPSKGEQTLTFRLERPADEDGRPRMRMVEAGTEATAPVYRKAVGRARWLIGTWTTRGPQGAARWVLHGDGRAIRVVERGNDVEHVEAGRWEERAGRLTIGTAGAPLDLDVLPPEDGLVRARFRDARPLEEQPIWTRTSWPPKQSYLGPLIGRWDVADAALPTAWFFGPYGRYERRRAFGAGAIVERGGFQVTRGATGEVLHLESDAGHRRVLELSVQGTTLRMTDPERRVVVVANLRKDSATEVAADAILEATARADTEATYRFLNDERVRITAPTAPPAPPAAPPTPEPSTAPVATDPAPHDVFAGMEAFRRPRPYRFESEQVLALDARDGSVVLAESKEVVARAVRGSARPRVVITCTFGPDGRVSETTDTWTPGAAANPVVLVRHGKYGLQGDVVLVQFEGVGERRWRLGEAGRYIYRGEATAMATPVWENMSLDGPKFPW